MVRYSDGGRSRRLRSAIAIAALAWLVMGVIGSSPTRSGPATVDSPHAAVTSLAGELASGSDHNDHPYLDPGSSVECHKAFATSGHCGRLQPSLRSMRLPQSASSSVPVPSSSWRLDGASFGAGATPFVGQDLLTRLCVLRR
jgi:hypothetical protein